MNQRLKELAEQAGFYYTDKTGFITPAGCDPAKLAELIVKECADIANGGWAEPGHQIKQHFGVE
jgi:hypothetical protein